MQIDWKKEAAGIADEMISIRHWLHMHPELGNHEDNTSRFIEEKLNSYGISTERFLDTAVIGVLRPAAAGSEKTICGKTAALRADMDALPITEATGVCFASINDGIMHACGHDVHMSAALGTAHILSRHATELPGTVKFIFQPDEEGDGGADRLVKLGIMKDVDAVFGAHVSPDLKKGKIGIRYGKFYAASDVFKVTVTGLSCHGAEPEKGHDALFSACRMVDRLHFLPELCRPDKAVLSIGRIDSGTAVNIISDSAVFEGIIRTLGAENRALIKERFRETIAAVCAETGVTADIHIKESYPGVVNSPDITDMARAAAVSIFGDDAVEILDEPTMTTEDFGYYIAASKGTFYHLGAGGDKALHNCGFLPDDDLAVTGAAMHAGVIWDYLAQA